LGSPVHIGSGSSPPKTALVVGPDSALAAGIATILPDWKIERAEDNAAAFAVIESKPFELVLTGENTTGEADVELLRQLRLVRPHTRLIILTNESTPADVIASMREQAFSYFSKPLSWTQYVEISYLHARHVVMCRVKDPGEGFSLDEIRHAAIANPPRRSHSASGISGRSGSSSRWFWCASYPKPCRRVIYGEKGNEVLLIKYMNSEGPYTPIQERLR
jgi:CheY-like chemotaxis protein